MLWKQEINNGTMKDVLFLLLWKVMKTSLWPKGSMIEKNPAVSRVNLGFINTSFCE